MIPIADDNRDRTITPYVNYMLIAINIIVFVFFQGGGTNYEFTYAWAAVPEEILTGEDVVTDGRFVQDPLRGIPIDLPGLQPTPISVYLTLVTAVFMHGSWVHLGGNLLYLWIFGDNLEDWMGHGRYLLFYLLCGVLASLVHVYSTRLFGDDLRIPSLGASGAISGVLGGYILLFPRKRVTAIVFYFVSRVPAVIVVGLWFLLQLYDSFSNVDSSIAYAAHIGGFIFGFLLVRWFDGGRSPKIDDERPYQRSNPYR